MTKKLILFFPFTIFYSCEIGTKEQGEYSTHYSGFGHGEKVKYGIGIDPKVLSSGIVVPMSESKGLLNNDEESTDYVSGKSFYIIPAKNSVKLHLVDEKGEKVEDYNDFYFRLASCAGYGCYVTITKDGTLHFPKDRELDPNLGNYFNIDATSARGKSATLHFEIPKIQPLDNIEWKVNGRFTVGTSMKYGSEMSDLELPIALRKKEIKFEYVIKKGKEKFFNYFVDILQDDEKNWELVTATSNVEPYSGTIVLKVKENVTSFEVPFETVTGKKLSLHVSFTSRKPTPPEESEMDKSDTYFVFKKGDLRSKTENVYKVKKGCLVKIKDEFNKNLVSLVMKIGDDSIDFENSTEQEKIAFFQKYNLENLTEKMEVHLGFNDGDEKNFIFEFVDA